MGAGTQGNYPVNCGLRNLTIACFTFVTVNGAVPTTYSDGAGLLASTPFTYDSEGTVQLNLKDDYRKIFVVGVEIESTTDDDDVKLESVVETAGANSVTVRSEAAGTAADLPGAIVHVTLALSLSNDA